MQTCAGSAAAACVNLLEETGGRVILCQAGANTMGAGPLKSRDNAKEYNQAGESKMFGHTSEHEFYGELGKKALKHRVVVDMFVAANNKMNVSMDLASLSVLTQYTGGDLNYYHLFDVQYHGEKLYYDMFRNLSRNYGNEVMIKARCSAGM